MQEVLNIDIFNTQNIHVPNLTATGKQLDFLLSMFFYASILCGTEASAHLMSYAGQKHYQDTSSS